MADDVVRGIPEEMVEAGARALAVAEGRLDGPRPYHLKEARVALSAALAGRTVLELPKPNTTDSEGDPAWTVPGVIGDDPEHIVAYVFEGKPLVSAISPPDDPDAAEVYAVTLIAACRDARRRAAGSGVGDQDG